MKTLTTEDVCKKDFEVFCDLWNYDKTTDEFGFYANSLTQRCFDSFCAGWRDSRKALVDVSMSKPPLPEPPPVRRIKGGWGI